MHMWHFFSLFSPGLICFASIIREFVYTARIYTYTYTRYFDLFRNAILDTNTQLKVSLLACYQSAVLGNEEILSLIYTSPGRLLNRRKASPGRFAQTDYCQQIYSMWIKIHVSKQNIFSSFNESSFNQNISIAFLLSCCFILVQRSSEA
jgi:hypothetical protein